MDKFVYLIARDAPVPVNRVPVGLDTQSDWSPSPTGYTMKVLVNRDVTIPIPPIPIPYSIGSIGIVTSLLISTFIVYPVGLGIQSDWVTSRTGYQSHWIPSPTGTQSPVLNRDWCITTNCQ